MKSINEMVSIYYQNPIITLQDTILQRFKRKSMDRDHLGTGGRGMEGSLI